MSDTTPALELRGLTKAYDGRTVVDEVDLVVPVGQTVAVLGPNGAGKTTTIEICEGHRRATAGRATVLGVDPARGDACWRDRIGIVAQATGAFDRLTVSEAVGHVAGFHGAPFPLDEVLERCDLADLADRRVEVLSGGQQRRVDLACGIVGRPELLFLDEPTTGLDPESRRRMWSVVEGLTDGGTTVVLTTHHLEEAETLADRVVVLAGGRILADAPVTELGGRHAATARVTFRPGPSIEPALSALDGRAVEAVEHETDGRLTVRTTVPTSVVATLASHLGRELDELTVTRPSLEDVYLGLLAEAREESP